MSVEEEVFKIQKKMQKITSNDGTVSNEKRVVLFRLSGSYRPGVYAYKHQFCCEL